MPYSINFSVTLQTEILSTVASDFLKQMNILKVLYSMFIFLRSEKKKRKKHNSFSYILYEFGEPFSLYLTYQLHLLATLLYFIPLKKLSNLFPRGAGLMSVLL